MPSLAAWARPGLTWAPGVLARAGHFVLYYTARDRVSDRQCIGRAVSASAAGPFVDDSSAPIVCQAAMGGSIDASPFLDANGQPWLTWKNDGNCCNLAVGLWSQRVSDDGRELVGSPALILSHDQAWESPLIEGSSMLATNGKYYLLYSANWWESANYAVGYAVCDGPQGPCVKPKNGPIMAQRGAVAGPGGQAFFRDAAGKLWIAYHAWTAPNTSYASGGARGMRIDPIAIIDGVPQVSGPTAGPVTVD